MSELKEISEQLLVLAEKQRSALVKCQDELAKSQDMCASYKQSVQLKDEEITGLISELKTLKTAKALSGEQQDTRELKLKINEIIREVDSCIAAVEGE